jgi:hypothetical protein
MRTLRRLHRSTVVVALALVTLAGTVAPAVVPAAHAASTSSRDRPTETVTLNC